MGFEQEQKGLERRGKSRRGREVEDKKGWVQQVVSLIHLLF